MLKGVRLVLCHSFDCPRIRRSWHEYFCYGRHSLTRRPLRYARSRTTQSDKQPLKTHPPDQLVGPTVASPPEPPDVGPVKTRRRALSYNSVETSLFEPQTSTAAHENPFGGKKVERRNVWRAEGEKKRLFGADADADAEDGEDGDDTPSALANIYDLRVRVFRILFNSADRKIPRAVSSICGVYYWQTSLEHTRLRTRRERREFPRCIASNYRL